MESLAFYEDVYRSGGGYATLADRIYKCAICGLVMDRDENVAVNLERYPKMVSKTKTA